MNSQPATYQLVDLGRGKKLERFGDRLVVRPCPVQESPQRTLEAWRRADLEFVRQPKQPKNERGRWVPHRPVPATWQLTAGPLVMNLQPTPFGHLGVFPEQMANWEWISKMSGRLTGLQALNLFAYTGGTSLALAAAGAQVVHLDSSRSVVQWAQRNSIDSGLGQAPIRWIIDDALTFLKREIRRGRRYDIIVADPPAFGHGLKRKGWKFDRDLDRLLEYLAVLTRGVPRIVLLTGHSIGCDSNALLARVQTHFSELASEKWESGPMVLTAETGKRLPSGYLVRYADVFSL